MKDSHKDTSDEVVNVTETTDEYEINYDLVTAGPLAIDPAHKKPGYHYTFVADRGNDVQLYKSWGYNIVQDDLKVGDDVASKTSQFGSAVTVQSKCGQLLVLMAIKDSMYKKLMDHKAGKNKKIFDQLKGSNIAGIPEHLQYFQGSKIGEYNETKK